MSHSGIPEAVGFITVLEAEFQDQVVSLVWHLVRMVTGSGDARTEEGSCGEPGSSARAGPGLSFSNKPAFETRLPGAAPMN